jgi:hypothetical protein
MEVECCATGGGDQHDCGSNRRDARAPPVAAHSRRRIVPLRDWLGGPRIINSDSEDPHRPCDVLELLFACVLEGDIELAPNLPVRIFGDTNATGLRQSLQTRCHIHAIAENVISIDDDIADIYAYPELDAPLIWHLGIALGHPALDIKSAAQCVHYAAKLSQHPVPGVLDDPATVFSDLGIDKRAQMVLKLDVRALFVRTCQAAVAGHIGSQYGSKSAFDAVLT